MVVWVSFARSDSSPGENNDFYDNEPVHSLPGGPLQVEGEIAHPGPVDLSTLPLHSLTVRETTWEEGQAKFVGAYRYDGVSLFDILKDRALQKKNEKEFAGVTDLYVEIENARGEKVVASWGEIFYPSHLHRVLLAVSVAPLVPLITEDQWPIPKERKMVFGDDLIQVRNLEAPTKITVRSGPYSFPDKRGMEPLYAEKIRLFRGNQSLGDITEWGAEYPVHSYESVFYGRGRGFHGISTFSGPRLKDLLAPHFPQDLESLRRGIFTMAAPDGYRLAVSYSEIFNRNDQAEFLILHRGKEDGGKFQLFPTPDFFSDRALKAVAEIHLDLAK
jgi:hypothetical protein